ncbi:MAG: hypothetical protein ACE367_15305 [Acidimicrobiales bacterium]
MEQVLSDEEREGRQRRLHIIIGVAMALLVASTGLGFFVDRRADAAQADLRDRLEEAVATVEHEVVLDAWYRYREAVWAGTPHDLDELVPAEDRIAMRAEGETVVALYKAGFAGQDRCFDFLVGPDGTEIDERSC